ncbi:hypothetical protein BFV94_3339 [Alteromonas macleodii]|uniref:Uncharacterized protein n=1 Tax=Alteromonas macleodii TaxID=28108 RepID=A0AB36FNQ8_ALTMA|nr:hypothetical protein BFV93_3329 [Alteromonas macleodii]OES29009.1 hypothetical protein BFV94_3339 [Alteromonas macleodii]OES29091.1 hypothetical protein BFV95_3340 [Alteromonas macleodii]OES40111.1 hypothetical protein BFV96_3323 [Alteromonas macleodii]
MKLVSGLLGTNFIILAHTLTYICPFPPADQFRNNLYLIFIA